MGPPEQKGFGSPLLEQPIQGDRGEAPRLTFKADGFIYEPHVLPAALVASDAMPACGPQLEEHGQPAHVEGV